MRATSASEVLSAGSSSLYSATNDSTPVGRDEDSARKTGNAYRRWSVTKVSLHLFLLCPSLSPLPYAALSSASILFIATTFERVPTSKLTLVLN